MGTLRDDVREILSGFYDYEKSEEEREDIMVERIMERIYPRPEGAGTVVSTGGRRVEICEHPEWTLWMPDHRADRGELWSWWEKPRLESMWHNLQPGDVLFDIGTEEGDQSALYARWIASEDELVDGGIVLVEPNPMVWPNVKAIFTENGLPDPLACWVGFVGAESGGPAFAGPELEPWLTWPVCADGPMIGDHGFMNICERPDVPATTIDRLTEVVRPPDAITIDIEGAELLALRGAERTLREHKPLVWVSIHPDFSRDMYGLTRDDLLDFLRDVGYRWEHLAAEHEHHVIAFAEEGGRVPVLPYGNVR